MKITALALALLLTGWTLARAQETGHEGHDHGPGHSHGAPGGPPGGPGGPGGPGPSPAAMPPPSDAEKAALEKLSSLKGTKPKDEKHEKEIRENFSLALTQYVLDFADSPRAPFALEALLKLLVSTNQAGRAVEVANKFVEKTTLPIHKAAGQRNIVSIYRNSGQPDKAISYAVERAKAAGASPEAEWHLYEAVGIHEEKGKYEDAIALLEDYVTKNPTSPSLSRFQMRTGDLLISAGKGEAALAKLKAIDRATLPAPDAGMLTHLTAMTYMSLARHASGEAAAKFRAQARETVEPSIAAARKDPASADQNSASAFSTAADIALASNDVPGAIKIYEEMAKLFKDKPPGAFAERAARDATLIGTKLQNADGPTVDGKKADAKQLAGKIVLVDFFSLSNPQIANDVALYQRIQEKLAGKKFAILGVNLDKKEQSDTLKRFVEDRKIDWPVIFEGMGPMSVAAVSNAVSRPMNFVVDEDGTILRVALTGPHLEDTVIQEVARLEKGLPSSMKSAKTAPGK
jgi:tetratricopeptide (TPR) repeat protein